LHIDTTALSLLNPDLNNSAIMAKDKKLKTFCKWSPKQIEKNFDLLTELLEDPTYVCKKCARVSNSKKALCKPVSLPVLAKW